ncbi:MAG: hypothetical protein AAF734_08185 [Bacteroidota bacterium]
MGLFDFLFGKKKNKTTTLEGAKKENEAYIKENPTPIDDEDGMMRKAASLLSSGEFKASMELYQQMAEKFPDKKGLYLSQVGANQYFLGQYEEAIDTYLQAKEAGFEESMIDDNVFEACEALYKQRNEKMFLEKYVSLFPNGNHLKKAHKLLSK